MIVIFSDQNIDVCRADENMNDSINSAQLVLAFLSLLVLSEVPIFPGDKVWFCDPNVVF